MKMEAENIRMETIGTGMILSIELKNIIIPLKQLLILMARIPDVIDSDPGPAEKNRPGQERSILKEAGIQQGSMTPTINGII